MPEQSTAWLLEASGGDKFAVAEYEMIEYVVAPELISVPLTPVYCAEIIMWHKRMVPVLNFGVLFSELDSQMHSVCILAYQKTPGEDLNYIGVSLQLPPVKIIIKDDQAGDLQELDHAVWRSLSVSCFKDQEITVPILGIETLDSKAFREQLADLLAEKTQDEFI